MTQPKSKKEEFKEKFGKFIHEVKYKRTTRMQAVMRPTEIHKPASPWGEPIETGHVPINEEIELDYQLTSDAMFDWISDNFVSKEEVKEIAQEFYNKGFGVCHYNDALERGEYEGKPLYYDDVLQQLLTKHKITT